MTNAQLYILLAPALVSLFGVFFMSWRSERHIDAKIDSLDKRVTELKGDLNRQFDKVNHTLELIQQGLVRFHGVQSAHEAEISNIKERLKN